MSRENNTSVKNKNNDAVIQVRVPADLKERTAKLFQDLGTNTSNVINMMLVQADKNQCIPFEIKSTGYPISANERVDEVAATMDIEGMPLDGRDYQELYDTELARVSDEDVIKKIIEEEKED